MSTCPFEKRFGLLTYYFGKICDELYFFFQFLWCVLNINNILFFERLILKFFKEQSKLSQEVTNNSFFNNPNYCFFVFGISHVYFKTPYSNI